MIYVSKNQLLKSLKSKAIISILILMILPLYSILYTLPLTSQSSVEINNLIDNPKLINPEDILADFKEGKSTTRIIINLLPAQKGPVPGFKDKKVRQKLKQLVKELQARVIAAMDPAEVRITNRFVYIYGFAAEVTISGLKKLVKHTDVLSINKDRIRKIHTDQGISLMNAATVRSTYNGSGVAIAICDTGIDYTHPRLGGGSLPNGKVIGGYDCGDDDYDPMDEQGHGTCCAGIAAGSLGTVGDYIGGVAYNAKLYAVKISYGSSGGAYDADMIEGWEWCVTHQNDDPNNPIMVISTSFGGGQFFSTCDTEEPAMTTAAANANAVGITLFVSSGNDGYCDSMGWPACISHVISVGAVYDAAFGVYQPCISSASCATKYFTPTGCRPYSRYYAIDDTAADMVTSYSNTASFLTLLAPANMAHTTDIVGGGGYNTGGDYYDSFGGTSAACPYAAGAAACLQQAVKDNYGYFFDPTQLKIELEENGDLITDDKVNITKPRINLDNTISDITRSFISTFQVYQEGGQTVVHWETESEVGTNGFNLLRKDELTGQYQQLNSRLLTGLLHAPQGGTYRFIDETAVHGGIYTYKLVEQEAKGSLRQYGPYRVEIGQKKFRYPLQDMQGRYHKTAHKLNERQIQRFEARKLFMTSTQSSVQNSRGSLVKIGIREQGIYHVSAGEIASLLGININKIRNLIQKGLLKLSNSGLEVAWLAAEGNAGVYFYGESLDSPYTRENIYWLEVKLGQQMEKINTGSALPISLNKTFTETGHFEEERHAITSLFTDPETDYWFWDYVIGGDTSKGSKSFTFVADGVAMISQQAQLKINLQGASEAARGVDHHATFSLNGTVIGDGQWDGTRAYELNLQFSQLLLKDGMNTLQLTGLLEPGVSHSIFYLDSFDLEYQRLYQAVNNQLAMIPADSSAITVSGFSSPDIMVFDVSSPRYPQLVTSATIDHNIGYQVSFIPASQPASYETVIPASMKKPVFLRAENPVHLSRKLAGSNYLIITSQPLKEAAEELASYRQSCGLQPEVITLSDIYNSYNYGIPHPETIKKLLMDASSPSKKQPLYVVLAGEGSFDYRNLMGFSDCLVPSLLVASPDGLMASDTRYGYVKGNEINPWVVIGRIPVLTPKEFYDYIAKVKAYESGVSTSSVVLLADNDDKDGDFSEDSDQMMELIPESYLAETIYLSNLAVSQAKKQLINVLNRGVDYFNYLGHAGIDALAQERLLTGSDLGLLHNSQALPVITLLTCMAGNFVIPSYDSLAEQLVVKADGGAIAVLSPTGMVLNGHSRDLGKEIYKEIFSGSSKKRLGEVLIKARINYYLFRNNLFIIDTYNILGDPGLEIK
jgi:subtilisin family serine protease